MGDRFTRDDLYVAIRDALGSNPTITGGELFVADVIRPALAVALDLGHEYQETRSWNTDVSWALIDLRKFGYLVSPPESEAHEWSRRHGYPAAGGPRVWRLTAQGQDWVRLRGTVTKAQQPSTRSKSLSAPRASIASTSEQKRKAPLSQDRDNDLAAHDALDRILRQIRTFLNGYTTERPSDEVVCDWMQLCYMVGLHRETGALFEFVDQQTVSPFLYRRVKRLAQVAKAQIRQFS